MSAEPHLPRIALTMGDAAGIGPELVSKVLLAPVERTFAPAVVGDPDVMRRAAALLPGSVRFRPATPADLGSWEHPEIPLLSPPGLDVAGVAWGRSDSRCGAAAGACIASAFELARQGLVDGVVCAPLCKETFHAAGYGQTDELEYLAELTGTEGPLLVGVADELWTVAVTLHVPLRQVAGLITCERVRAHIAALHEALARTGHERPVLAVAGLNPHAGDGGLLGREEIDEIAPAVAEARAAGIDAVGPLAADTIFVRAFRGEFAGVVCMYHDQANIARKLRSFASGATLLLGLPVPYGTTAHGTAFDLAGRGVADPGSLTRALSLVATLARSSRPAALEGSA